MSFRARLLLPLALCDSAHVTRHPGNRDTDVVDAAFDILLVGQRVVLSRLPLLAIYSDAEVDETIHLAEASGLVLVPCKWMCLGP